MGRMAFAGDVLPIGRAGRKAFVCSWCGKIFWDSPARNYETCGKQCANALRSWRSRETKFCKTCGKAFSGTKSRMDRQDYCSLACAPVGRPENKETRTCVGCGAQFKAVPSVDTKYCSHGCYIDHRRGTGQKTFTCEYCGKEFIDRRTVDRRYCSRECNGKALSENNTETVSCARCGEEFVRVKSSSQMFCSRECSNLFDAGYEDAKDFPERSAHRYRQVAEEKIGRDLMPGETVHHINMDCSDDRPENVHVFPNNQQHHWAHGTLNGCVKTLMELDFLRFDGEKYYVPL